MAEFRQASESGMTLGERTRFVGVFVEFLFSRL
jgi:hypothetical protein